MTTIEAFFDHGVFRPVTPIEVPEGTRVEIVIDAPSAPISSAAERAAIELNRRLSAAAAHAGGPETNDGLGGKDHDHILYGTAPRHS